MALTCSILGTYYILCSQDRTYIFIIFFGFLSFNALAFYTICCHKAYEIPGLGRAMKDRCCMMVDREQNNSMTPWEKKVSKYRIRAWPNKIGIQDGGFRMLESSSTLEFLDFYMNQVISLSLL